MKYEGAQRPWGLKTVISNGRRNILRGHATSNIQMEPVEAVKNVICVVPADYTLFDAERRNSNEIVSNTGRSYKVSSFYSPRKVYHIALKENKVDKYVCPRIPRIQDSYIGFCRTPIDNMSVSNLRCVQNNNSMIYMGRD